VVFTNTPRRKSIAGIVALGGAAVLLFSAAPANAGELNLRMTPKKVDVGKRTCFNGEVRNGSGGPVARAEVVLEGAEDRSNRRGKVRVCRKLQWPGIHTAQAFKGQRHDLARLRARSNGAGAPGTWHPVEIRLRAYKLGGDGYCERSGFGIATWGVGDAGCYAIAQAGDPGGFSGKRTWIHWRPDKGRVFVRLFDEGYSFYELIGYVTSPASGHYYVEGGCLPAVAPHCWVSGGTNPNKPGQPEGPLLINVTAHDDFVGAQDGYTFHIKGFLFRAG